MSDGSTGRRGGWIFVAPLAAAPLGLGVLLLSLLADALGLELLTQIMRLAVAAATLGVVAVGAAGWLRMSRSHRWRAAYAFAPRPSTTVPRWFLRYAGLIRRRNRFVLVLGPGQEQRFGLPGEPTGLSRITIVGGHEPRWIDLQRADGEVLARLRADEWVGGEQDLAALRRFCERNDLAFDTAGARSGRAGFVAAAWSPDVTAVRLLPVLTLLGSAPAILIVAMAAGGDEWWPVTVWLAFVAVGLAVLSALGAAGIELGMRWTSRKAPS